MLLVSMARAMGMVKNLTLAEEPCPGMSPYAPFDDETNALSVPHMMLLRSVPDSLKARTRRVSVSLSCIVRHQMLKMRSHRNCCRFYLRDNFVYRLDCAHIAGYQPL